MADSKVSDLTTATTVGSSDLFYLVQSNDSKKVTAATLFSSAANVTLNGNVNFQSGVQLLASPGIIDLRKPVTHLSSDSSGGTLVLPAGTINQVKIVAMISTAGGAYTISSNIANSASVVFNNVGDTATMMYTNGKWFVIGGTASLT